MYISSDFNNLISSRLLIEELRQIGVIISNKLNNFSPKATNTMVYRAISTLDPPALGKLIYAIVSRWQ